MGGHGRAWESMGGSVLIGESEDGERRRREREAFDGPAPLMIGRQSSSAGS